jgi:type II secretory pathway component PulM
LEDATERQNEAFERERAADARVEQISEYVADLEGELRRNQRSKEALQLWNKGKAGSLGGFVEKLANNGSHLQVIA